MTELLDDDAVAPPRPVRSSAPRIRLDRVDLPAYNPERLTPAVVHLGFGNFHRAHQAVYFDDLACRGNLDWGVIGVGIRRPEMRQVLGLQGNLFSVIERSAAGDRARVIGSVTEYLLLARQRERVLARLCDQRTRLVTMTITGAGYVEPPSDDSLFAVVAEALEHRRRAGLAPFTVLSCDNLPDSGAAARAAVLRAADPRGPKLVSWVERNVSFPSSLVDRITPATTEVDRDWVESEFGLADAWPVITEPFRQWIIEDQFCNGRPPLDDVGARFVDDVGPYKKIKARLLNGSHSALGYLGTLADFRTTDQAMTDPVIGAFVQRLMAKEVAPTLPRDVPGIDLDEYQASVLRRFRNSAINDDLSRLSARGSRKMPDYVLPSLIEARSAGRPHRMLLVVLAAWLRYLRGSTLSGAAIVTEDPKRDELQGALRSAEGVSAVLGLRDVFGALANDPRLATDVQRLIASIDTEGLEDVLLREMASV